MDGVGKEVLTSGENPDNKGSDREVEMNTKGGVEGETNSVQNDTGGEAIQENQAPKPADMSLDNEQTLRAAASELVQSILSAEPGSRPSTSDTQQDAQHDTQQDTSQPQPEAGSPQPQPQTKDPAVDTVDSSEKPQKPHSTGPIEDPYVKATRFLEKHQLLTLFQTLTADIVLKRPPDPLDFMIEEIETLQEQDRRRKGVFVNVNREKSDNASRAKGAVQKDDIVGKDSNKL